MNITLHGVAIGGGIAIGRAHLISRSMDDVAHYGLEEQEFRPRWRRFDGARHAQGLEMLWGSIPENAPAELGAFLSCTSCCWVMSPFRANRAKSSKSSTAMPNGR
jgi:phosphotransferase system enzyme I (PtsI)